MSEIIIPRLEISLALGSRSFQLASCGLQDILTVLQSAPGAGSLQHNTQPHTFFSPGIIVFKHRSSLYEPKSRATMIYLLIWYYDIPDIHINCAVLWGSLTKARLLNLQTCTQISFQIWVSLSRIRTLRGRSAGPKTSSGGYGTEHTTSAALLYLRRDSTHLDVWVYSPHTVFLVPLDTQPGSMEKVG